MGGADGKENLGEGAHVGCGTPSVLVGRDGFGEARELVFLNHSISENFREILGDSGRALFVRIQCKNSLGKDSLALRRELRPL
jgi:hypothetical protein